MFAGWRGWRQIPYCNLADPDQGEAATSGWRRLRRLLAQSQATLTLRIEGLHRTEVPGLDYLLKRLARYGDRVSIVLDRKLRDIVRIDSSVFHLVLVES